MASTGVASSKTSFLSVILVCFIVSAFVEGCSGRARHRHTFARFEKAQAQIHKLVFPSEADIKKELRNTALNKQEPRKPEPEPDLFEVEVKDAQNTSTCSYTVEPVLDKKGNRVRGNLEHVKCNNKGCLCQDQFNGTCCVQTYQKIDVFFDDNTVENMKVYVGCVCALKPKLKSDKDEYTRD